MAGREFIGKESTDGTVLRAGRLILRFVISFSDRRSHAPGSAYYRQRNTCLVRVGILHGNGLGARYVAHGIAARNDLAQTGTRSLKGGAAAIVAEYEGSNC